MQHSLTFTDEFEERAVRIRPLESLHDGFYECTGSDDKVRAWKPGIQFDRPRDGAYHGKQSGTMVKLTEPMAAVGEFLLTCHRIEGDIPRAVHHAMALLQMPEDLAAEATAFSIDTRSSVLGLDELPAGLEYYHVDVYRAAPEAEVPKPRRRKDEAAQLLPRDVVEELGARIKPVVAGEDGTLSYIEDVDLFKIAYSWKPVRTRVADDLAEVGRIVTLHNYNAPAFFKPSQAEVLSQIPLELRDRVTAYHTDVHPKQFAYGGELHMAWTTLYARV